MSETANKPLIPQRVMLVGEEAIPRHVVEGLEDFHMQVFMREPDPRKWPQEMQHLVEYLPAEDRVGFFVSAVLVRHEDPLREFLVRWTKAVWKDFGEETGITPESRDLLIEEMIKQVAEVVSACAKNL